MPMVYIKQINEKTFLHFSFVKEGFRLRNFSPPDGRVAEIVKEQSPPEWTATEIRRLANVTGNWLIPIPEKSIEDYRYWHEQTVRLNKEYLSGPLPQPSSPPPPPHGWRQHVVQIIVGVIILVLAGLIMWALKINR